MVYPENSMFMFSRRFCLGLLLLLRFCCFIFLRFCLIFPRFRSLFRFLHFPLCLFIFIMDFLCICASFATNQNSLNISVRNILVGPEWLFVLQKQMIISPHVFFDWAHVAPATAKGSCVSHLHQFSARYTQISYKKWCAITWIVDVKCKQKYTNRPIHSFDFYSVPPEI